jgi:hypothetical protein
VSSARPKPLQHAPRLAWDLLVPFGVLWAICVVHVLWVIANRAAFGAGDTIALGLTLLLPWLLFRAR